jgi:hypothetical protein
MSRVDALVAAGRRIDAAGAEPPRFPLEHVETVRERTRELMLELRPQWLVSSAACGVDLIAQSVAMQLGIARRIVLPFGADQFRNTSVVDRPGDWGPIFDRVIAQLTEGNLIDLALDPATPEAYVKANDTILDQGLILSGGNAANVLAMVVWEGRSRGPDDVTAAFEDCARRRGIAVRCVSTS